MLDFNKLKGAIYNGLTKSVDLSKEFCGEINGLVTAEYFLTSNIAISINKEFNRDANDDYSQLIKIIIENRVKEFYNKSYPDLNGDLFNMISFQPSKSTVVDDFLRYKRGKIDIGIYTNNNKPITLIEVKKYSPTKKEFKKDLFRILKILDNIENTGESSISKGFLTFVFKDDRFQGDAKDVINKSLKKYTDIIKENTLENRVNCSTYIFSESYNGTLEYEEFAINDNHFFGGLIIEITK